MSESPTGSLPRWRQASRWILGSCGGLLVAIAWLFCVSGWGMTVPARGIRGGGGVFYGLWLLCLVLAMRVSLRGCGVAMAFMAGLGWVGASVGSIVRASPAMRWHPVVLGVNLCFLGLGVLTIVGTLAWLGSVRRRSP